MTTPDANSGTAVPDGGADTSMSEPGISRSKTGTSLPETGVEAAPGVAAEAPAPLIRPDSKAAAFFDLDNTVIQGASLFHLARGLYKRGFFPTRAIVKGIWLQTYFRIVGRENDNHMQQARDSALSFIAGHTVQEIAEAGEEIYEESILPKIWPGTRALVQTHLDVGQQVWVVTAAPIELASIIATRLGLTGALATVPESIDGVYTGRLKGDLLHGVAKADAVRGLAAENGLDLARCFAYSDSYNDLPMLSLVGHPCAVNPDRRLTQHAQEVDWQIRDFRTHRQAVRLGLLGAGATGVAAGALAAGFGVRRILKRD
ncbi:MAG TPA: HAD family hydrolase [Microlunatus sp.]